jgi:hypothetical protein
MFSASKRKEPPVSLESPVKKKLSRCIYYNKNKKPKWELEYDEKTCEMKESISPVISSVSTLSKEHDIVFNPPKVLILFLFTYTLINFNIV